MKSIKLLDNKTINKIAAGEVVERPASVIKELIENSIDAESTSITVEIIEGGKSYIRITDNGVGIDREDIELAFLRHSTSKISKAEDLSYVSTLGFRGEALASISSISQIELISKTDKDVSGIKAIVNGGTIKSKTEVGCPKGTTIIVRNLFYNTPVRQKFLKSDNTETTYISDIIYKLAISNPNISFTYIKDNKPVVKTPGRGDVASTAYSILGKEFIDSTFEINNTSKDLSVSGFIGKPSYTRANRSSQYIFINRRYIKDIGISKIIEDSYSTLITTKRYPVVLLFINIDFEKVDINVHPTKTEVRFSDRKLLDEFIANSIKDVLRSESLIPSIALSNQSKQNKDSNAKKEEQVILDDMNNSSSYNNQYIEKEINNDFNLNKTDGNLKVLDFNIEENPSSTDKDTEKINESSYINYDLQEPQVLQINKRIPEITVIGSLFKTYILGQDKNNKMFYMIDQHAAHERIMYEKIKKQFISQEISTQILLNTEILELSLKDIELVKSNIDMFLDLGFDIDEFGANTIALRGVPMVFGNPNSKKLFLDILDNLDNNISSNYELRLEKIMKLACTSAIKANDNIADIEIQKLMDDLEKTEDPFTCPHGRPIIIEMSKYEIERKFRRS